MSHMSGPDQQKARQNPSLPHLSSHPATSAPNTEPEAEESEPEDAEHILTALERDDDDDDATSYPPHLRESRAQALAAELQHARRYHQHQHQHQHSDPHTSEPLLTPLTSDDSVLKFTTQNRACVVHFSHGDFARCGVMDRHLRTLVPRHAEEASFGRVDVRDAPFVVERLGVRVLPCVVGFRDGVAVGRIVGFEGVFAGRGGQGQGQGQGEGGVHVTRAIERVVVGWRVFGRRTKGWLAVGESGSEDEDEEVEEVEEQRRRKMNGGGLFGGGRRGIKDSKKGIADDDDDDDDDWD